MIRNNAKDTNWIIERNCAKNHDHQRSNKYRPLPTLCTFLCIMLPAFGSCIFIRYYVLLLIASCAATVGAFPNQGKWDFVMSKNLQVISIPKSLFAESRIYVQIVCDSLQPNSEITISWWLSQLPCWAFYPSYFENSMPGQPNDSSQITFGPQLEVCSDGGHIPLHEVRVAEPKTANRLPVREGVHQLRKRDPQDNQDLIGVNEAGSIITRRFQDHPGLPTNDPVFQITKDGIYLFTLQINSSTDFNATVHIEIRGTYGFLSAADYPLLPFYGFMCIIYVFFGVIWLAVSFAQWRDLLRIQFWIGGVILLGMLEKAMFYAEYQSINSTGTSVQGAVLLAEWVSCGKRTLARMLVIIVSLGFGIVKPRLGPMLHRVVGIGTLYFVLACVESYMRTMHTTDDGSNQFVASIPLAILDSAICWWIFTSLVNTTRTLRLRRNTVKLTLYRHFTNTLIFAVIASVIFMLVSVKTHQIHRCLTDWKDLWQDDAYWHVLFSSLLLVIMILWRPTNNNQRYAFTPLLDHPEDEEDSNDEEDQFVSDVYGVKMRGNRSNSPKSYSNKPGTTTNEEDDLRWVEENIPTAIADAALPILDSDEEIINTRFEVSKMQ